MSGHRDPSRMCSKDMPHAEVADTVNYIANCGLSGNWQFGKESYSRDNPSPVVSRVSLLFYLFSAADSSF